MNQLPTRRRCLLWLLALSALGLTSSAAARADDPPPAEQKKPASDLDRQLLEGLGAGLLDDLPDLGPVQQPATKPAEPPAPADEPGPPRGQDIEGLDGEDLGRPGESADPFTRIGRQMRQVERRIAQHDASDNTQQLQQEIITSLDKLIEQAKQQQPAPQNSSAKKKPGSQRSQVKQSDQNPGQQQGDGSGNTSQKPAKDSSERQGPDETRQVDMRQMRNLIKDIWGNLPERMREQMNQDAIEEFLPKYRLQIEEYFKRLAEEQEAER